MSRRKTPVTPAVRVLRNAGVEYTEHVYSYDRYPGALGAAEFIGIDPHLTAKTIVFETSEDDGAVVLMHGDFEVSTKNLARIMGVKSVEPTTQDKARRWTGYQFGGTSPFGMKTSLPIFAQREIAQLERVYINAGSRGFVVGMDPRDLLQVVAPLLVDVAISEKG